MYSSIIPAGALIILVGLAINYWVVKFTILRRCSLTHKISGNFVMFALTLLDVSLIMKPIGEMIFDSSVR
jgi:flagellar biosynthesis protein FliP